MTPQPARPGATTAFPLRRRVNDATPDTPPDGDPERGGAGRYSLGGEARRVLLRPAWKVKDIVVPLAGGEETKLEVEPDMSGSQRSELHERGGEQQPTGSPWKGRRVQVDDEERKVRWAVLGSSPFLLSVCGIYLTIHCPRRRYRNAAAAHSANQICSLGAAPRGCRHPSLTPRGPGVPAPQNPAVPPVLPNPLAHPVCTARQAGGRGAAGRGAGLSKRRTKGGVGGARMTRTKTRARWTRGVCWSGCARRWRE